MSAQTRTVQQPMGAGSIILTVVAAAILVAALAVGWSLISKPAASTSAVKPLAAPALLDRGGRELGITSSANSILDRGGRVLGPESVFTPVGGAPGTFHAYAVAVNPGLAGQSSADKAAHSASQTTVAKPGRHSGSRAQ